MERLAISPNQRFLLTESGAPFFWLGDTAWELFHRLDREEAAHYLEDRAAKGFNLIQAVVLAELDGLHAPNPYGHTPLFDDDPEKPNQAYFEHVDWIVDRAEELGLYIGMLPTWGDKWHIMWHGGPEIFTPAKARSYGEWLGRRYAEKPIVWILGGDREIHTDQHREILRALAAGLATGDGGAHLMTYHPGGAHRFLLTCHDEDWLDFNMIQSGHRRPDPPNYQLIADHYAHRPTKPVIDGEPCYEDHPIMTAEGRLRGAWFDDLSVRQAAYWAVFAGAFGHTYGCHPVWQMFNPKVSPINGARRLWYEALQLPGAAQMGYLRQLIEARPFTTRIPDQSLILSEAGQGDERLQATCDRDRRYTLIYYPQYQTATIDLSRLAGDALQASWFNPRSGREEETFRVPTRHPQEFTCPHGGPDWVLCLTGADESS